MKLCKQINKSIWLGFSLIRKRREKFQDFRFSILDFRYTIVIILNANTKYLCSWCFWHYFGGPNSLGFEKFIQDLINNNFLRLIVI